MKNKVLSAFLLCFAVIFTQTATAQKFSYVDSEYILEQLPDYRSSQKQLDDAAEGWKKDMLKKKEELDKLKTSYEAEYLLLPDEQRKKKEEEITLKNKEYETFKKEKFGPDGELYKKRIELIKPIQDKVFEAVQKVAKENNQDFILDKAGAVTILFSNPKYDRSDEVLELLGVGANVKPDKSKTGTNDPNVGINKLLKDDSKDKKGNNLLNQLPQLPGGGNNNNNQNQPPVINPNSNGPGVPPGGNMPGQPPMPK